MSSPGIDYFFKRHPLRGIASRVSFNVRARIFEIFMNVMNPGPWDTVLDVGVTPDRSLPESNFFEQFYPYTNRLTATSIEDASFLADLFPGLRFVRTGEGLLPFENRSFNIVFCSAVLEHVGDFRRQRQFVRELLRVSDRFFISTPHRWFPVEFHTFLPLIHWLPKPIHRQILHGLGMHFWAKAENLNLLVPAELRELFVDAADVHLYRVKLAGIPSNLIVWGKSGSDMEKRL